MKNSPVDSAIVRELRNSIGMDGMSLVARTGATPAVLVDRLQALMVAGVVKVVGRLFVAGEAHS